MRIDGLQKMTLLDFPGKVACTVFTGGCNFRCPFCHNALLVTELPENPDYTADEVLDFLKKRSGLLDGVAITGGEPLMNPDIPDFIKEIRKLGYQVKLDTNGSYPDRLESIVSDGLVEYVAMDIKNCKEKYAETIGLKEYDLSKIEKSVDLERLLSGSSTLLTIFAKLRSGSAAQKDISCRTLLIRATSLTKA